MKELLFGSFTVVVMYLFAQAIVLPMVAEMNHAVNLALTLAR